MEKENLPVERLSLMLLFASCRTRYLFWFCMDILELIYIYICLRIYRAWVWRGRCEIVIFPVDLMQMVVVVSAIICCLFIRCSGVGRTSGRSYFHVFRPINHRFYTANTLLDCLSNYLEFDRLDFQMFTSCILFHVWSYRKKKTKRSTNRK